MKKREPILGQLSIFREKGLEYPSEPRWKSRKD
jgi:hypothetical protein